MYDNNGFTLKQTEIPQFRLNQIRYKKRKKEKRKKKNKNKK